ncbi:MAG: DUF2393 family protein [Sulfurimonadaceae bacterium]|nr:DUF2393 family protein [Sulfurimonadaceae bacterium]
MNYRIAAFIDQLALHDYILFGASLLLFVLFLILAVVLRKKTAASVTLVLLAFAALLLGPTVGYMQLNGFIYKHTTEITEVKALEFSDALVVRGTVTNLSKRDFNQCQITAGVYKVAHNPVLDTLFQLNPFKKGTILEPSIAKGEVRTFKLFVEPFHYTKDYNVSIGATCR